MKYDPERIAYALRCMQEEYGKIDFRNENIVFVSEFDNYTILGIKNIYCPTKVGIAIGLFNVEEFELSYKAIREFEEAYDRYQGEDGK
jgi:hypothetical protein